MSGRIPSLRFVFFLNEDSEVARLHRFYPRALCALLTLCPVSYTHLVPGLIANDMYKQGIFRTLLAVMLSGALLRVLLMVVSAL